MTKKLKITCMRREVFDALPEHSMSNPTGLPVGKKWKRHATDDAWLLAEVTHHTTPARDQFDRPLSIDVDEHAKGARGYPIGEPGDMSHRIVHIKWTRIAILDGDRVIPPPFANEARAP